MRESSHPNRSETSPVWGVPSHQIGSNNFHFCEAENNCQPHAAVSFGNVKETKEPGKSTLSDGETDGESSARIYPSKLKDKNENVGENLSNQANKLETCCEEQTVHTQPFNTKQPKNTSVNSEPDRVETLSLIEKTPSSSPPATTTTISNDDSYFSMGSIDFQPVGLEETPSDLSDLDNDNTDQINEVSETFPECNVEKSISPNSDYMGTINLESVDAYDETLDSDYEEPEDDCPDKSKSPDRPESKKGELRGRNKYNVHYKLYHGGKKVSVKLRKCSVSLARLSRTQSNTGKRLKRREVWISRTAGASGSRFVGSHKWKTNDLMLPGCREATKTNQSVPAVESPQGRVRTLLDPLKPLVAQVRRLHLLLPEIQPDLPKLERLFPPVVSNPGLAQVVIAFLRFYQVSLDQLDQKKTR